MDWTGPGIWTDTVFSDFNNPIFSSTTARNISPLDFFKVTTHKEVGDVVILPITSFIPGAGHMGAKGFDDPWPLSDMDSGGLGSQKIMVLRTEKNRENDALASVRVGKLLDMQSRKMRSDSFLTVHLGLGPF